MNENRLACVPAQADLFFGRPNTLSPKRADWIPRAPPIVAASTYKLFCSEDTWLTPHFHFRSEPARWGRFWNDVQDWLFIKTIDAYEEGNNNGTPPPSPDLAAHLEVIAASLPQNPELTAMLEVIAASQPPNPDLTAMLEVISPSSPPSRNLAAHLEVIAASQPPNPDLTAMLEVISPSSPPSRNLAAPLEVISPSSPPSPDLTALLPLRIAFATKRAQLVRWLRKTVSQPYNHHPKRTLYYVF